MSAVGIAASGNGLFRVTFTQDDVNNTWTAVQITNNDTILWNVNGNVAGVPFSFNVPANTSRTHTFNQPIGLIPFINWKGQSVLVPSLDGTTPVAYSIAVEQG